MYLDACNRIVREVASVASSLFDPKPIQFRSTDEIGVRPVRNACNKPLGTPWELRRPLNRNAFLLGCLNFTEHEAIEHLIIGLGYRHEHTTKVCSIIHETGSETHVALGARTDEVIRRHLESAHKAEVLVFHNHPPNPLNRLFDNGPVASDGDRRTWHLNVLEPFRFIKALSGGGRFLCYIAENGFVGRIRTPQLLDFLCLLRRS
ncbi:MAG: hypothetical protein HYY24_10700 [Verrucomicrobia bacterium]|nr:hypothetical protein [Verrucomicrobiota bacterium]